MPGGRPIACLEGGQYRARKSPKKVGVWQSHCKEEGCTVCDSVSCLWGLVLGEAEMTSPDPLSQAIQEGRRD